MELFRHTGDEGGADQGKFGALASCCQELVQVIGNKKLDIFAGAVFKNKRDAARSSDSGDRGWRETEDCPIWKLLEFLVQTSLNGLILLFRLWRSSHGFSDTQKKALWRKSGRS